MSEGDPHLPPDFALPDAEGNVLRLADYRGKRSVVVFFARAFR